MPRDATPETLVGRIGIVAGLGLVLDWVGVEGGTFVER